MSTIIVMDPVTRIEGHLKVEVSIENGSVADARCSGTMFRGFERILVGRDSGDGPIITQRICGVCPISHAMAGVLALDHAVNRNIPANGRILRNLTLGANFVQSHILHFYLLAALDFLKGPGVNPWVSQWDEDLRADPALSGVGGHLPAAIEARRRAHEMGAAFGGRMPSAHALISGGYTNKPTTASIAAFRAHLTWLRNFIRTVYLPDVQTVARVYADYLEIGRGAGNLLAYGVFDLDNTDANKLLRRGFTPNARTGVADALQLGQITESVAHSWYDNADNGLHPSMGLTDPQCPKSDAYSWLKAPRYLGEPAETGALARMWINGDYQRGVSVLDRHAARALECLKVADAMDGWLNELSLSGSSYDGAAMPTQGTGTGLTEAPRGALGHWVTLSGGLITHYQIITPTCWNASPRDSAQRPGPMEQALLGTTVRNETMPIEVLRVIHSFDPCLSCAVHIMKASGKVEVIPVAAGPCAA